MTTRYTPDLKPPRLSTAGEPTKPESQVGILLRWGIEVTKWMARVEAYLSSLYTGLAAGTNILVKYAGTTVGTRPALDLRAGRGITRTVADSSTGNSVTDTVAVTGAPATLGDIWTYSTTQQALPVGTTGYVLTADPTSSYGIAWKAASGVTWSYTTLRYSDFSTAGTSLSTNAFSLPAACVIHGVVIKTSTAFSGGAISAYALDVGISGDTTKYLSGYDGFAAVSATNFSSSMLLYAENFGTSTSIQVTATSTGGNLNTATAGVVDIWIYTSVLTYPTTTGPAWSAGTTWRAVDGTPFEQAVS